jgi:hypothetical protein
MCQACANRDHLPVAKSQRRKIWDLSDGWHCAIIGTCLSLRDLRALGRKLDLQPKPGFPVDYQLHGHFVGNAASRNKTSKFLDELLNRKHAIAIRKLGKTATPQCLTAAWEEALADGDIPGPFWAIMSHPETPATLAERMFADVHMLSHLVGSSNRADIRRLGELEEESARVREERNRERRHHAERMAEKSRIIEDMQQRLAERAFDPAASLCPALKAVSLPADRDNHADDTAQQLIKTLQSDLAERDSQIARLSDIIRELQQEAQDVEHLLQAGQAPANETSAENSVRLDLTGRCILYVGGRPQSVNRYRQLLQSWNGELLHHDGGLEKSLHELASAIARADTVVFPCDCVSHDAVCNVKKLCRQLMKTYLPLRSSGLSSLVAALHANPPVATGNPITSEVH